MKNKKPVRHRRSNISIYTKITASLPFIDVDLSLTSQQMKMFINGFKYIIPCQSRFSRRQSIDDILTEQYQTLSTVVKDCLKDNGIIITDARTNRAFQALRDIFSASKSKKLSTKLTVRAQREYKTVQDILRLVRRRSDIVIRRTDKSKVFYIGKADDFERKAEEYMLKTEAYEEITSGRCPLAENFLAVQTLLHYLVTKNALTKKQRNYLCPKLNTLELGHYHGIPKPHKVNSCYFIY